MKLLVLLALIITPALWSADRPTSVETLFQTTENLSIVSSPDRVEACILYMKEPWFSKNLNKRKYKEGRSMSVPPEAAKLLSAKLTDTKTYRWDSAKTCLPLWNARVKFFRGNHYISADFCFSCKILMLQRDGQPFSGEDFDEASETIFEIIRSMFPKDRVIQDVIKLKEMQKKISTQVQHAIELEKMKATK